MSASADRGPSGAGFQPQQRLHPMSWLFGVFILIRQFIFPLIAAAIFSSRDGPPLWLAVVILPLLAAALWKQHFYRYGLGPQGLVIREGILFRNVRQVDYERIENIDTERGVLHRLLDVAEVRVETSTGGKPEALIQVLSTKAAEELRQQVFASRSDRVEQVAEVEQEKTLLHLTPGEVVRFGLVDNRGMIVVAGAFGLLYETGLVKAWGSLIKERLVPGLIDDLAMQGLPIQVALVLGTLFLTFVLLRALSVLLALLTLYDFRLVQAGADLRARYGLLTRIGLTLRVPRVQAARQTQNLVHRFLKRATVRVDLAGDGGQTDQHDASRSKGRWLAPIARPEHAHELMTIALPDIDMKVLPDWQPLGRRARGRVFRLAVVWWVLAAVALAVMMRSSNGLLVLAAGVPLSWLHAVMYVRYTRWALERDALWFHSGWLTRELVIVPRNRVQAAQLSESPFDRRHAMAAVSVDTAGASSGVVRIPYLERDVAINLTRALYISASHSASLPDNRDKSVALG
jgi:putative membrane protein